MNQQLNPDSYQIRTDTENRKAKTKLVVRGSCDGLKDVGVGGIQENTQPNCTETKLMGTKKN